MSSFRRVYSREAQRVATAAGGALPLGFGFGFGFGFGLGLRLGLT